MDLVQKVEEWVWGGGDPVVHCHLELIYMYIHPSPPPQPLSPSQMINEREWVDSLKI